jgi:hypothetical protein
VGEEQTNNKGEEEEWYIVLGLTSLECKLKFQNPKEIGSYSVAVAIKIHRYLTWKTLQYLIERIRSYIK